MRKLVALAIIMVIGAIILSGCGDAKVEQQGLMLDIEPSTNIEGNSDSSVSTPGSGFAIISDANEMGIVKKNSDNSETTELSLPSEAVSTSMRVQSDSSVAAQGSGFILVSDTEGEKKGANIRGKDTQKDNSEIIVTSELRIANTAPTYISGGTGYSINNNCNCSCNCKK